MRDVHFGDTRSQKSEPCHETYYGAKETYYGAKETYYGAQETYYGKETYYGAKETYYGKSVGCTCVGLELVVNDNGRVVVVAFLVVLCLFPLCPATWLTRLFHACQPKAKD
jgi:hypothetical protein